MNISALTQSIQWLRRLGILTLTILSILFSIQLVKSEGWQSLKHVWIDMIFGTLIIDLLAIVVVCGWGWRGLTRMREISRLLQSEGALAALRFWIPPALNLSNMVKLVMLFSLIFASAGFFVWHGYSIFMTVAIAVGVGAIYFVLDRLQKKQLEKQRLGYEWYRKNSK